MAMTFATVRENKTVQRLLWFSSICGALVAIYNFGDVWDKLQLPRPIFVHEYKQTIAHIAEDLRALEIDYRKRAIMYDQKTLREIDREIADRTSKSQPVPSTLQDIKQIIEDSLNTHKARLKYLEDNKAD